MKQTTFIGTTFLKIPVIVLSLALCLASCRSSAPAETDNTDLFYILSTNVTSSFDSNGKEVYNAVLTQDEKERMQQEIDFIKQQLGDSLNLFAPFYRQFTMNAILLPNDSFAQAFDFAKRDIQRQFKHYLRHTNTDRPFFLAGFSQGAMFIPYLLREMSERDYQRCLGAYMMGYQLTRQDLLHHRIAVAHSELDGKVISFNSVTSPDQQWDFVSGNAAACINPLNWTTDGTPAVLFFNDDTIHIVQDTCSHLLICDVNPEQYTLPGAEKWWKHGCLHHWDILFYNQALHTNMLRRSHRFTD